MDVMDRNITFMLFVFILFSSSFDFSSNSDNSI